MSFYGSGLGDRLIDESVFPEEIKEFLKEEENLLRQIDSSFDTLIEVGCMHGRYLEWAVSRKHRYIGVDVVSSYISEGVTRAETLGCSAESSFILGGAEEMHHLLDWERLKLDPKRSLLFFPFNSIGNMHDCIPVIRSIKKSRALFAISTYPTTQEATLCRQKYYEACRYHGLQRKDDGRGVKFVSDDGLNTIAYYPEFMVRAFKNEGMSVEVIEFSAVGIAYVSTAIA